MMRSVEGASQLLAESREADSCDVWGLPGLRWRESAPSGSFPVVCGESGGGFLRIWVLSGWRVRRRIPATFEDYPSCVDGRFEVLCAPSIRCANWWSYRCCGGLCRLHPHGLSPKVRVMCFEDGDGTFVKVVGVYHSTRRTYSQKSSIFRPFPVPVIRICRRQWKIGSM